MRLADNFEELGDLYENCLECHGTGHENDDGDDCPDCLGIGNVFIGRGLRVRDVVSAGVAVRPLEF